MSALACAAEEFDDAQPASESLAAIDNWGNNNDDNNDNLIIVMVVIIININISY